jgi:spore coat polysaccharide biosynthesis protein SpsF (cytidylyltransferase family)
MRGRLCALQMHHTDVVPALGRYNAVERLRDSGLFERVVLAAADVSENDVLLPWAERFGVELFRGHAEDVARRLLDCAVRHRCDVVARALTWWFFIDLELVEAQLDALEGSDAEYVDLPLDFDLRFGADVMRLGFLERAAAQAPERFRRNPWGFAEAFPERFKIATQADVPTYDRATFDRVKEGVRALCPEQHDVAATLLHPYKLALELFPKGGRALDLATGLGAGAALLAGRGSVLGVDVDAPALEKARARYGDRVEFVRSDAFALDIEPRSLDLAVSVHTLEHVDDDAGFLARIQGWLKRDAALVLEVPLLARRPFLGIPEPLSPAHVREYDAHGLLDLVAERFRVREVYGVNRGAYLEVERARSAILVVAEPL